VMLVSNDDALRTPADWPLRMALQPAFHRGLRLPARYAWLDARNERAHSCDGAARLCRAYVTTVLFEGYGEP
jgi:hypothetical protein